MKLYLVTGGLGFIGSTLVRKLLEDESNCVFIVDDNSNNSLEADHFGVATRNIYAALSDMYDWNEDTGIPRVVNVEGDFAHEKVLSLISRHDFETVFHFAAKPRVEWSVEQPLEATDENLNRTLALAKSCADNNVRLVFSSTSSVYGNAEILPTGESDAKNPESPYGLSKYCAEQYMHLFEKLYGLEWVALRYFNVYGPVQRGDSPYSTAVAAWCHRSREGQPLRSDGDGEQSRDLVYVEDVADVNILCSTTWNPGLSRVYNVGSGEAVTNNWILQQFAERGYVEVVHAPARPGDVKDTLADVELLREDLGWSPKISIEQGINLTLDWWEL